MNEDEYKRALNVLKCWDDLEQEFFIKKRSFLMEYDGEIFNDEIVQGAINCLNIDIPGQGTFDEKIVKKFEYASSSEKLLFLHAEFIYMLIIAPERMSPNTKRKKLER